MSRSYTPVYRVEYRGVGYGREFLPHNSMAWKCREYGRPTTANLEHWRQSLNRSFRPGGCNFSLRLPVVPHVAAARIVEQRSGRVVASVIMPAFEVA